MRSSKVFQRTASHIGLPFVVRPISDIPSYTSLVRDLASCLPGAYAPGCRIPSPSGLGSGQELRLRSGQALDFARDDGVFLGLKVCREPLMPAALPPTLSQSARRGRGTRALSDANNKAVTPPFDFAQGRLSRKSARKMG